ncbi:MAG TPA: hypothetical protein VFR23_26060, partial [Jiangellaceae bacterium]|nr:hypothetical protein [Jiangellaceae bacterium]
MTSGQRDQAEALLLDLDGVLRVFDPEVAASAERRHGLPPGSLVKSALGWQRLRPAIAGEETHAAWLESIVADLAPAAGGPKRAWAAVDEWQEYRGEVVPELLEFVRELRAAEVPVGLAT